MSDAAADQPPAVRVIGRVPWHPVLAALWPGLALWAANVSEVLPDEVLPALWQPLLAAGVLWVVAALALRSTARGAIVTTVAAIAALNAGRVTGESAPGTAVLVGVGVLVVAAAVLAWWLPRWTLLPVTTVLNVTATVVVLLSIPPILTTWGPGAGTATARGAGVEAGGALAGRDIWYVIPDRYPRADTFAEVFGFDNTPFLSWLEDRGFQVADRALANYPKTAHSLAATWNLAPIEELVPDPPADGGDWQPLYALLRDHELGRILTDTGYEYVHVGTWWSPTSTAESADRVLRVDTDSEFVGVWRSQTVWPAIAGTDDEEEGDLSLRERNRRYSSYQLDELDALARQRSRQPRFVLAHVTVPHEPYVFDADGSLVTAEQARSRTREENIVNQTIYLNGRLQDLIETLTAGPPETWPVIVIQSDEGPHPRARTGPGYDWTSAPDEVLAEKLRVVSAILLPESDVVLPEDLTGVDTWRYVLDATVGTDLGPVEDPPIEVFRDEDHLYDLVDVSDRVE